MGFLMPLHLLTNFEIIYKSIMKMNQDLMVFILETICQKNKGWGIRNKP